jgi:hypothetical protein
LLALRERSSAGRPPRTLARRDTPRFDSVASNAPHCTSDSKHALVDAARIDALREVEQIAERPAVLARLEHRLERALPDAADGAEPEADLLEIQRVARGESPPV